jgi:cell division septation protein DedD
MNPTLWLVASSVGAVVLVALAVIYRRAAARRELELAEAAIEEEYAALPRSDEPMK